MKTSRLSSVTVSLLLAASVAVGSSAYAHGDADAAVSKEASRQAPDTVTGIWQAIDAKTAELKKSIDGGTLANVHHEAYAVRDLVAALPGHTKTLPSDQLAKIQSSVKFVATLAERLDVAGDANDKPGAQSNYDKLMKVLADLRTATAAAK